MKDFKMLGGRVFLCIKVEGTLQAHYITDNVFFPRASMRLSYHVSISKAANNTNCRLNILPIFHTNRVLIFVLGDNVPTEK